MAPIKSSLARSATKLFGVFRDRDLSLRGIVSTARVTSNPFTVSGGNAADGLAPGNGYKYHTFTTPGTLTISGEPEALEVLMVAGGGGGIGGPGQQGSGTVTGGMGGTGATNTFLNGTERPYGGGGSGGAGASGQTSTGQGGGGVGLYGEGSSGTGGNGAGGSGGTNGTSSAGGTFGGGGGAGYTSVPGAQGGIRIIWGDANTARTFPSTNTDQASSTDAETTV